MVKIFSLQLRRCIENGVQRISRLVLLSKRGIMRAGDGQVIAAFACERGGKSGLQRAGCQITSGRREPTTSAAESIPPKRFGAGKGERVR